MSCGAQVTLCPMTDDYVKVILGSLSSLDPYRDQLKISSDDISTLFMGPYDLVYRAMDDLFVAASRSGVHTVMHATISRGCPGWTDDPSPPVPSSSVLPIQERKGNAIQAVSIARESGQEVTAQFALYVLGVNQHMDEINGCIDFLQSSGTFDKLKNFVTKLRGDSSKVFTTVKEAFVQFGPPGGHVTVDLTISANSPSPRT